MNKYAIICVDDELIILDTLKIQFKKLYGNQYLFEIAESVEEAWEVIEDLQKNDIAIGIVVSDWLMPKVRGDKFLIDIHKKYPEIVKVLLTGQADEEAIKRVKNKADLHYCLYKPWKEKDLYKVINSGMEKVCNQP